MQGQANFMRVFSRQWLYPTFLTIRNYRYLNTLVELTQWI